MGLAEWVVSFFVGLCVAVVYGVLRGRVSKMRIDPKKTIRNVRWPE